ncbi:MULTISPECIES: SRPBCC family protein [Kordiimonas]|jgi:hypothetical protein|uniref:SRPBCC family protein n=1 Tax=Kordiimonas TaxID=288021 RepID=UPI002580DCC4|nr:SRPBCC domain-containing protein [Kordiimonas sp. UBA4487]
MANICLTFGTEARQDTLANAVRTLPGLAAWWTDGTSGDPDAGGKIAFRFGEAGGFDMRVKESNDHSVVWECTGGPDEWLGTGVEFKIQDEGTHRQLMFRHTDWEAETPFFHHCSMKWATFLLSLKAYVETGKGRPFPNDLKIEATGM